MRRSLKRSRSFALLVTMLAVTAVGCIPAPTTDAGNASGTGGNQYGWFEAGRPWQGDFADPHVVLANGTYYAYASPTNGRYMPVVTSTDLTTWTAHPRWTTARAPWAGGPNPSDDAAVPVEIRRSSMSAGDKWNMNDALVAPAPWALQHDQGPWIKKDLWAPGVIQMGPYWVAYYATKVGNASDDPHGYGRFCISKAVALSPLGPFRDTSPGGPLVCDADPAGSIDPSPYHDPATNADYLLWKAAGKVNGYPSALKAVRLGADGNPAPGAPWVTLMTTNEGSWEGYTIENPSMVSWQGTTYLFYSGNDWTADDLGISHYATGWAVCPQGPLGPCYRGGNNPILTSSDPQQGPGGATAFVDKDGQLRIAYSYYWLGEKRLNTAIAHPRRLAVARILRGGDGMLFVG